AIGYYGSRGRERLTEQSPKGTGFLPDLCDDWEEATAAAADRGVRVALMRFGIVLGSNGGALQKMLFPFKLGVGGIVGGGQQCWSWITLDGSVGAIVHALQTETLRGPVNVVTPGAVTNYEFTKVLGRVLGRPTILPMPVFVARLLLGEMADGLLLASA